MILKSVLNTIGNNFGLSRIFNEQYLNECCRTAFVWTKLDGSICLATGRDYFAKALSNPNISCIITSSKFVIGDFSNYKKSIVTLKRPDEFFYYIHNLKLHEDSQRFCFKPYIHPTAKISSQALVSPLVQIGSGTVINAGAVILDNTIIGEDSVIHQCTIGTEGFFSKNILGEKKHIMHYGGVKIGNNCIMHAGTNISRAVNVGEYTTVGNNSHTGIQSNIAHDTYVGSDCDISAKVCIAGRANIGDNVWIGAGAIISNNVYIGTGSSIKLGSVVVKDVPCDSVVSGNFAISHKKHMRKYIEDTRD